MTKAGAPILVATRSAGKLRELRPLIAEFGFRAIDLIEAGIPEDPAEEEIEAFDSFEENALAKARYFGRASGLPTVADDSGLEVMVLGGHPGVRSKRWSGRADLAGEALDAANNAKLMAALGSKADRWSRYVCVAAYHEDRREEAMRGEVGGRILEGPLGAGGFGYDPYFWSAELGKTFGEASLDEKATVSHRARAFRALFASLVLDVPK